MKKLNRNEFYELSDAERKEWREAMLPTWTWAEGRVGKEVIDILHKATGA
jgi:C4-dicarboxylate-binding protein DctP